MNAFQELVRARLRERTPKQKALADFLHLDESIVQRRLKEGGTALCLDFLDAATAFYQMSVSEMCAQPDAAWQEVKPLEAALLMTFRAMTELERRSLLTVLQRPTDSREARKARLGRAMLTAREQELVDLFARVKRDGVREGVLKTLRGAVESERPEAHPIRRTTG